MLDSDPHQLTILLAYVHSVILPAVWKCKGGLNMEKRVLDEKVDTFLCKFTPFDSMSE